MNDRPKSLHEIATRAEDLKHFGREFTDWLHTVRALRSRTAITQTIAAEPPCSPRVFPRATWLMPGWLPMRNILRSLPASPCRRGPTRPDESRARHGSRLIARCPALSPSATARPPSRTAISSRHGSTSLSACGLAAHPRQPKKNAAPMRNASGASAAAAPSNGNFTATLAQCLPAKNNGVHAQPRLAPQLRRRTQYPRALRTIKRGRSVPPQILPTTGETPAPHSPTSRPHRRRGFFSRARPHSARLLLTQPEIAADQKQRDHPRVA